MSTYNSGFGKLLYFGLSRRTHLPQNLDLNQYNSKAFQEQCSTIRRDKNQDAVSSVPCRGRPQCQFNPVVENVELNLVDKLIKEILARVRREEFKFTIELYILSQFYL